MRCSDSKSDFREIAVENWEVTLQLELSVAYELVATAACVSTENNHGLYHAKFYTSV